MLVFARLVRRMHCVSFCTAGRENVLCLCLHSWSGERIVLAFAQLVRRMYCVSVCTAGQENVLC